MKTITLVVLSLDVAIYHPLRLSNHTIIPKLKSGEGGQRKARMQSRWELADRKAAGIKHRQPKMEQHVGAALPKPYKEENAN